MTPYEEIIANDIQKYVDERGETYTMKITSRLTGVEEKWSIKVDRSPWWKPDAHDYRLRYYCQGELAEAINGITLEDAAILVKCFELSIKERNRHIP